MPGCIAWGFKDIRVSSLLARLHLGQGYRGVGALPGRSSATTEERRAALLTRGCCGPRGGRGAAWGRAVKTTAGDCQGLRQIEAGPVMWQQEGQWHLPLERRREGTPPEPGTRPSDSGVGGARRISTGRC